MNIKNVLLCITLSGLGMGAAMAEDAAIPKVNKETQYIDLHEEIVSPITGQFSFETTTGVQQDFGGLSGNSTGMDGFPDAMGGSSSYPQNNPEAFEQPSMSQTGDSAMTPPTSGGGGR